MTNESKEKTEPWIEKNQVAYPYAYDKGGKLKRELGVRGIPAAFLVNPKGKVVWKGHPASLSGSVIKKYIKGAKRSSADVEILTRDWPESAKSLKKMVAKSQFGKALKAAQKLAEKDPTCQAVVETMSGLVQEEIDGVKELQETGDILGALDAAKIAKKDLAGCDQAKDVDALVKAIKAGKDASKIVRAQVQLAKLEAKIGDARKRKDAQALLKKLDKLIAKNADNYAGECAEKVKSDLTKRMERMRR